MNQDAVAVIIPHYDNAEALVRALLSVAQQTLLPREVLVVDDASRQENLSILEILVDEHVWPFELRLLRHRQNMGPAAARNSGWEAAMDPLIAFLDADDTWHPQKLEIQVLAMSDNWDLLGHSTGLLRGDVQASLDSGSKRTGLNVVPVGRRSILRRNPFSTPSVMVRRELGMRFDPNFRFAEDYELWLRVALEGFRVGRISTTLAYVHKRPFGEAGLSAQLWKMEKGELAALAKMHKLHLLSLSETVCAGMYSILKYLRRELLARMSGLKQ